MKPQTTDASMLATTSANGSRQLHMVKPNAVFSGAGPRCSYETYDVPGVRCNT